MKEPEHRFLTKPPNMTGRIRVRGGGRVGACSCGWMVVDHVSRLPRLFADHIRSERSPERVIERVGAELGSIEAQLSALVG